MSRKALITGITGQDGAYLAEFLLAKGYEVHGIKRRASSFNTDRIDHLYQDPHDKGVKLHLHYGDLTDATNLIRIVQLVQPDEIYNLAAQSHVAVSFETPEYTANADALGTLRILEAIRILGLEHRTRFYQASTSEMFGKVQETPQRETTPFYPRSPSWRRQRSAASAPTTPIRPISCATTCRSRPTSSTPPGAMACRSCCSSARAASTRSSRRNPLKKSPC